MFESMPGSLFEPIPESMPQPTLEPILELTPESMPEKKRVKKSGRMTVDEYFLKIAAVVAERSTCLRHHVGAIAVKDRHILSTGYNGAPSGTTDCLTLGCLRNEMKIPSGERHEICRAVHAEQNVVIQAALHGSSLEGATIYSTHTPCTVCSKILVNSKIKRFVSFKQYDETSHDAWVNFKAFNGLFKQAGIDLIVLEKPSSRITFLD